MMRRNDDYEVFLLPAASKELEKLPKKEKLLIKDLLKTLKNPFSTSSRKMKGDDNSFRIRSGDYRIIFKLYPEELIVLVIRIAHRKKVYK